MVFSQIAIIRRVQLCNPTLSALQSLASYYCTIVQDHSKWFAIMMMKMQNCTVLNQHYLQIIVWHTCYLLITQVQFGQTSLRLWMMDLQTTKRTNNIPPFLLFNQLCGENAWHFQTFPIGKFRAWMRWPLGRVPLPAVLLTAQLAASVPVRECHRSVCTNDSMEII